MKRLTIPCAVFLFLALASCSKQGQYAPVRAGEAAEGAATLMNRDDVVKNAYIGIKDRSPDAVRAGIYAKAAEFEARVVEESWSDCGSINYRGSLELRIPSSRFLPMVDWLKASYDVSSMNLRAHEVDAAHDAAMVDATGTVWSVIYLDIERRIGFRESFGIGLEEAGSALNASLRTLVPVVVFLLPYAALVLAILFGVKALRKAWKARHKPGRGPAAPEA